MRSAAVAIVLVAGCAPVDDMRPFDVAAVSEAVPENLRSQVRFADREVRMSHGALVTATLPVGWLPEATIDPSWLQHLQLYEPSYDAMIELGVLSCPDQDWEMFVDGEYLGQRRTRDAVLLYHASKTERVYVGFDAHRTAWVYRMWWRPGDKRFRMCRARTANRLLGLALPLLRACETMR